MARQLTPGQRVVSRLIGLALEVPPAAYVVLTGHAPAWVRIWLGVWLALWLLATVINAAKTEGRSS